MSNDGNKKKLSLVIPVYNEGVGIAKNIRKVQSLMRQFAIPHEFVLVDDGSRDNTWKELQALSREIPEVRAIKLSRNFGKEAALCAGLDHVEADGCLCMDADLQHPPELIAEMYRLWNEEHYEVIEGVKESRGKESILHKVFAKTFYKVLRSLSGIDLDNASDFRLLDGTALQAWKSMPEKQTFFRGMSSWIGFNRVQVPFQVAERMEGATKWSFLHLVKLAMTAITSFSAVPLYLSALMGFVFLLLFVALFVQTIYMKFYGHAYEGFTTVIIGIYLEKIYEEVKARPRYLVQCQTKSAKDV